MLLVSNSIPSSPAVWFFFFVNLATVNTWETINHSAVERIREWYFLLEKKNMQVQGSPKIFMFTIDDPENLMVAEISAQSLRVHIYIHAMTVDEKAYRVKSCICDGMQVFMAV